MGTVDRIEPTAAAVAPHARPQSRLPAAAPPEAAVAVRPVAALDSSGFEEQSPRVPGRPLAAFLAQLIASDQQVPQARALRRAAPDQAMAAYTAAATRLGRATASRLDRRS